ncbi:MAG: hypothetical protein C4288_13255 [Leptolyngbya sp. ERB_1_1]
MEMRTWIALSGVILTDALGNVFLTAGMKRVGDLQPLPLKNLPRQLLRVLSNFQIVCGIFSLTIAFFLFISLLSWANLSFVYPTTSLTYLLSLIGARYFLHERITPARLVGTVLVCVGAAFVSIG